MILIKALCTICHLQTLYTVVIHPIVSLFAVYKPVIMFQHTTIAQCLYETLWLFSYQTYTSQSNEVVVLELMWSNSQYTNRVLVSPAPTLLLNTKTHDEVQLDPNFAGAIGIKDKEQVCMNHLRIS